MVQLYSFTIGTEYNNPKWLMMSKFVESERPRLLLVNDLTLGGPILFPIVLATDPIEC